MHKRIVVMSFLSRKALIISLVLTALSLYTVFISKDAFEAKKIALLITGIVLLLVVGEWGYNRNKWIDLFLDLAISAAAALFIFRIYPGEFFDDAGFEMRYLENFSSGYFYSFNSTDGPVFGISSPFQGLLNGFLCYTHILIPEQAMRRTAFAGLLFLIFFMIRIIRNRSENQNHFLIYALLIICSSKMFLNVAKSGLETPLHLSLVLGAFWAYYYKKERIFWFLLALSVISKLDAVPLAVTLGIVWIVEHRKTYFPISFRNRKITNVLLFAALPVLLWVAFAIFVFGSPLPQSAYSKIHHHGHPGDHWFPFLTRYSQDPFFSVILIFTFINALIIVGFAFIKKKLGDLKNVVPGLTFISTMILYYFYNPGERMMWYYAMPDILLLLQFSIGLIFLIHQIDYKLLRTGIAGLSGLAFSLFILPDVIGGKYWLDDYLSTVEY
ncbi:MAG: hypothetical protein ACRC3B_06885 [Bacteroidia bacterium]